MTAKIAKILGAAFIVIISLNFYGYTPPDDVTKAENFKLKDIDGKSHSLSDYKDSKAVVLIFMSTQCPVSNAYNDRMKKISDEYKGKDVAFLGIMSNKAEGIDEIKSFRQKTGISYPLLKDDGNKIADKFDAQVTPEVYILNSGYEVLYHGRIDDSKDESSVKNNTLRTALDEILAGKKISNVRTKAFGCSIKREG